MSSPTFRFVHAADLHLDAPFTGLRRAPSAITHKLGHAPLAAWDALVQLTIDQNAAFLLLAGDICDGADRAIPAQLRLLSGLQRLASLGVRTFIVRGPGDPADRWMGIHRWPEGVHCFGSHAPESVAVRTVAGHIATIHGLSHSADRSVNRVARFRRGTDPGLHIGLLHATVRAEAGNGDHFSVTELQTAGMDYWALGSDHRYREVSDGHPRMVYPGTLQGRSLRQDETGAKGAVVVSVTDGMVSQVTHHALDAVRLIRASIDASAFVSASDLGRALQAEALRMRTDGTARTVVAGCDVLGRRPAWMGAQLADGMWDRVLDDLRRDSTGDTMVWWDSVVDSIGAHDAGIQDDASAYLSRLVDVFRRAPAGLDRLLSDHNVALGPAMFSGPSAFDPMEVSDLLNSAERMALSLLEPRQP
jgi:hypothetical protein